MCELSNTSQNNQEPRKDVINPLFDGREQFPKASPRGEVDCQRQDGVVNESVVNSDSKEQPSSQEYWIATASKKPRNDEMAETIACDNKTTHHPSLTTNPSLKYSFLMSVYAKEKPEYLKLALNSMLNQTVKPDEVVIVKDGLLTEELEKVINAYKEKYPNIFTILSNDINLGLGLSLNKGLVVCRNEFVARMDSDDICYPERCEKELEVFKNDSELSLVGAYISEFSETPDNIVSTRKVPLTQEEIFEFAKRRSAFNHPVVMFKKSKVLELGGYSSLRRNQDVDLFGRMLFAGCKAANIGEPLLYFRTNNDLAKRRRSWENSRSYIGVIYKQYKSGYSSLFDFLTVAFAQIVMFVMPIFIQHFLYKHFLRG